MNEFQDVHGRDVESWAVKDQHRHGRQVRSMFARISGVYDFMNHFLSLNRDKAWRRNVTARLDGDVWEILDLCAGTCDLALTARDGGKGRAWIAADFCPEMLQGSAGKAGACELWLTAADAMNLPFAPRSVDAVTVGFGVRNFADVRRGLEQIRAVLRPGGQLVVLEFFRDDPAGAATAGDQSRELAGDQAGGGAPTEARGVPPVVRFGLNRVIPLVGKIVGRDGAAYSYLPSSMGEFLTPAEFAALLAEYGFVETFIERQTLGIAHIVGGRLPHE